MKCILRNVISSVLKYQIKIISLCIEIPEIWYMYFVMGLHFDVLHLNDDYISMLQRFLSLHAWFWDTLACFFRIQRQQLYMYETMIWSQNKVVSWCVNFFGTHHLSYCSCVILHHIYPIIVYTLILSVVMGRGGGWQARGAVFYEKKLKQINSHIQSNLDIQDYFNGMTRNGVKKIILKFRIIQISEIKN